MLAKNFSTDVLYPFGLPKTEDSKKALSLLVNKKVIKKNIVFDDYDLIIDALFGTGFNKQLDESTTLLFNQINKSKTKCCGRRPVTAVTLKSFNIDSC